MKLSLITTLAKKQNGVRRILQERNLWPEGKFNLNCAECALGEQAPRPRPYNCCAMQLLVSQPDYLAQREWLVETVEDLGHRILFLPKFHCELNYIEIVWAFVKAYYRRECQFSFPHLRDNIDDILLNKVNTLFVRRVARHCYRFMDGYRMGRKGPLLDYAVKKFKCHRSFPTSATLQRIEQAYAEAKAKRNVGLAKV
jgi:hypothetical protein